MDDAGVVEAGMICFELAEVAHFLREGYVLPQGPIFPEEKYQKLKNQRGIHVLQPFGSYSRV